LQRVEGALRLKNLESLESAEGLSTLQRVDVLQLYDNAEFSDLSALYGIQHIETALDVRENPSLPECQIDELLSDLVTTPGSITRSGNDETCPP